MPFVVADADDDDVGDAMASAGGIATASITIDLSYIPFVVLVELRKTNLGFYLPGNKRRLRSAVLFAQSIDVECRENINSINTHDILYLKKTNKPATKSRNASWKIQLPNEMRDAFTS